MSKCILDASAVLILFNNEPGNEQVIKAVVAGAVISVINISEVVAKLAEAKLPEKEILETIGTFAARVETVDFDTELAYQAGMLRTLTKRAGLSFGDRACLALAKRLHLPALTADRAWENVPQEVGVEIIRISR